MLNLSPHPPQILTKPNNYSDNSVNNYIYSQCVCVRVRVVYALFCGITTTILNNCDQIMRKYLIRQLKSTHQILAHSLKPMRNVNVI